MDSKGYAVLDVQNDDEELQFQEFGLDNERPSSQTHVFTNFPDSPGHQGATDKLLGEYDDGDEDATPSSDKPLSFWTFEYYQQFFDVDSKKVGDRIIWSMVPKPGINYLQIHLRPRPDLYGPFWICLTLVFAAAITGNISNYLQTQGEQTPQWRYDFHKVSLAAVMVFSYAWLLPLILWGTLRYKINTPPLTLLELVCLYGYSLSVMVPVCIVWTVPMAWLRWCVGIVGVVLSGVVLSRAVWDGLRGRQAELLDDENPDAGTMKKMAIIILLVVIVMHVAIAIGFMFYFFSEPLQAGGRAAPVVVAPVENVNSSKILQNLQEREVSPTKREVVSRNSDNSGGGGLIGAAKVEPPGNNLSNLKGNVSGDVVNSDVGRSLSNVSDEGKATAKVVESVKVPESNVKPPPVVNAAFPNVSLNNTKQVNTPTNETAFKIKVLPGDALNTINNTS